MAPVTRRKTSAGVSKPPLRKSKTRDDSFNGTGVGLATSVLRTDADAALQSQPEFSNGSFAFAAPSQSSASTNGVHDVMQPLSTMAERVGREVEDYAEKIDRWRVKIAKAGEDGSQKYKATIALVDQLEGISKDRLAGCKHKYSQRKGRAASSQSADGAASIRDAQVEVDTWRLFRIMLGSEFRDPAVNRDLHLEHYRQTRGEINTYTTGDEIWERFLIENDIAREQAAVLRWLEQTARTNGNSSEEILARLEAKCGRGTGSYDRHWLYTREKLKSEKRGQVWGGSIEADAPVAQDADGKLIVSHLDPDAPTRQMRPLVAKDAEQDKAVWEACFQMIRSGVPWAEFAEWLDERGENWRGASLGISGGEQVARTNVEGPDYGTLWRRTCYAIVLNKFGAPHEQAVYGLLAGDLRSSLQECTSWDDFIYVHFNALLLGHFEGWLKKAIPDKRAQVDETTFPPPTALEAIGDGYVGAQVVSSLRQNNATKEEALEPVKQMQGALLGRQFVTLAVAVGVAASNNLYTQRLEVSEIMPRSDVEVDPSFQSVLEDETTLRLLVHFSMIFEALRPATESDQYRYVLDRIVVCYLDSLRRGGKFETLPTYAAFMEPDLADKVMGMMLADVANPIEQRTLINLMNKSGMNAVDALLEQVKFAMDTAGIGPTNNAPILEFDMLERASGVNWPGCRISVSHVPQALTIDDEKIIRAAEWYTLVDGQLYGTLNLLTEIYRSFLVHRRWNAAVAMTERIPFRTLVDLKTPAYYGRAVDFMEDDPPVPEPVAEDFKRTTRASSRQPSSIQHGTEEWGGESRGDPERVKQFHRLFKKQGQTYFELMQLTLALRALSDWRVAEDNALEDLQYRERPAAEARTELKDAFAAVCSACDPLLRDFLTHPRTPEEERDLSLIRQIYLPNIIIAYNSVLHFAGTVLSREYFLKSLNIAVLLAGDENKELRDAFISVERMAELTTCLTLTSRQLLRRNEVVDKQLEQKKRESLSKKRSWDGRTVDIWDIGRNT